MDFLPSRRSALVAAGVASAFSGLAGGYTAVEATAVDVSVPTTSLGSLKISRTIQGYWQLAGIHGAYNEADAVENMRRHFSAGVTTLDTADIYGPSELIVGKFVGEQPSAVPCTKFCCFRGLQTIEMDEVRARVRKQCERLKVDALPLVAFFWADYSVRRYVDVALMLTKLREEGLIKEIGVTNFDLKRLKELKEAGVPVVSNQVELSLFDSRPLQSGMADWCVANGVKLIAFGTVAGGLLSEKYLNAPAPGSAQLDNASLRKYAGTCARFGGWELAQELLKTMDGIARKHSVSIANVAQRYVLQCSPAVGAVLVGVRNSKHVEENVATHGFKLDDADMAQLRAIVAKRAGPKGDVWDLERGYI